MDILLNNKELDITLEKESNLAEVLKGIEKWLHEGEHYITSIKLDTSDYKGKEIFGETQEAWSKISLKQVEKVAIEASHIKEIRISSMETALQYLSMVKKALRQGDDQLLNELESGYRYISQTLGQIFAKNSDPGLKGVLENFRAFFSQQDLKTLTLLPQEMKEKLNNNIEAISKLLEHQMRLERDPDSLLKDTASQLVSMGEEISQVSVLLQTGKDRDAMNTIALLAERLQLFFRLIHQRQETGKLKELIIDGRDFEQFYSELNEILKELTGAFDVNDYVLIGDLLEYEIAPRLEEIAGIAKKLLAGV